MPSIFLYILKLSVALAAVSLFYQLVLRRLTFYNWNRWYLLGYTILVFLIPLINITPILENNEWSDIRVINWVPALIENTSLQNIDHERAGLDLSAWNIVMIVFISGSLFLFTRLIIQFISFNRMKKKATPFAENGLTIYQVNENIIPFSFGNSIFINKQLHSEEELREIIKHEFIHVKQKHSVDIIWSELLCLLNWYNPFAWLLKRAIRQNLEFIADNKVVQNGIDKKEYQYLLLKVIGNSQYSIATQFNFSSLKKRIAMMNKTKSAKLQLGRFLFLFPVLAIVLLAFRKSFTDLPAMKATNQITVFTDTIPDVKIPNSKGYYIDIKDNKGHCMVVVKDKDKKEVKRLLLTEWNEKPGYYENLYGEILSPTKVEIEKSLKSSNPEIRTVSVKNNIATVTLKNGKTEVYTLSLKDQEKAFEERCGIKEVAIASTIATEANVANVVNPASTVNTVNVANVANSLTAANVVNETIAENFEISDNKAVMHLKNGKTEEYNLANAKEKQAFEKKYGRIISPSVSTTTAVNAVTAIVEQPLENLVLTTASVSPENAVTVIDTDNVITGEEDILVTISKNTKPEELEALVKKMKEKGYEFKITNKNYDDGVLTQISGTVKYKDSDSSFSATDFNQVTISTYRDGNKIRFKIFIGTKKVVS